MKLSFNNPGYITTGFNAEIPMLVQLYMIAEIEALSELDSDKVDYFQVFRLKRKLIGSEMHQEITIEQENPPRQHTTYFPFSDAVNCTVFCIDAEEYHTYMLSSEY